MFRAAQEKTKQNFILSEGLLGYRESLASAIPDSGLAII